MGDQVISGAFKLVPYHAIKSLQTIWRSGTCRLHLLAPKLQMCCSDLTRGIGYQYSSPRIGHQGRHALLGKWGESVYTTYTHAKFDWSHLTLCCTFRLVSSLRRTLAVQTRSQLGNHIYFAFLRSKMICYIYISLAEYVKEMNKIWMNGWEKSHCKMRILLYSLCYSYKYPDCPNYGIHVHDIIHMILVV